MLGNAIEAAGDGGTVRLLVKAGPGRLGIWVEDSGPGIDPGEVDQIFRRGVSSKADTGRGIGLALVDRVIRRRAGSVSVDTGELGGALFAVEWNGVAPGTAPGSQTEEPA